MTRGERMPLCIQCGTRDNPCRCKVVGPTLGFVAFVVAAGVEWPVGAFVWCFRHAKGRRIMGQPVTVVYPSVSRAIPFWSSSSMFFCRFPSQSIGFQCPPQKFQDPTLQVWSRCGIPLQLLKIKMVWLVILIFGWMKALDRGECWFVWLPFSFHELWCGCMSVKQGTL